MIAMAKMFTLKAKLNVSQLKLSLQPFLLLFQFH